MRDIKSSLPAIQRMVESCYPPHIPPGTVPPSDPSEEALETHYLRVLDTAQLIANRGNYERAVALAKRAAQWFFPGGGTAYEMERADNFGIERNIPVEVRARLDDEEWNAVLGHTCEDQRTTLEEVGELLRSMGEQYEEMEKEKPPRYRSPRLAKPKTPPPVFRNHHRPRSRIRNRRD